MPALWASQPREQSQDFLQLVHSGFCLLTVATVSCSYCWERRKPSPALLRAQGGPRTQLSTRTWPPVSFPRLDKDCDHFPGPSQAFPGDPPRGHWPFHFLSIFLEVPRVQPRRQLSPWGWSHREKVRPLCSGGATSLLSAWRPQKRFEKVSV